MKQDSSPILERILAKGSLPSLSTLAVRLMDMAADDRSSAKDLAKIIEQDPGLTVRLLRLVNSPAYRRGPEQITNITRAVLMLGLREVRIMALSISLRDTLPVKKSGPDYHLFWRSTLHRAVLSREVARNLALPEAEEAFVAGLLLEMGLPLLLRVLTPEQAQGFPGLGATLRRQLAWERANLGLDHRQVGEAVLKHWNMPQALVLCQRGLPEEESERAPILVELTDFARRATEAFFLPEALLFDVHQLAWRLFGFDDEKVNNLLAASLLYVGEAAQALEIELDQEADLITVMENANAALSRLSSQLEPHLRQAVADTAPELGAGLPGRSGPEEQRRLQEEAVVHTLEAVVHEIRNPLMSVGGFARRLATKLEGSGGNVKRYADVLVSEAARLDQVLAEMNKLLSPYHPKMLPLDLCEVLSEARQSLPERPPQYVIGPLPPMEWRIPAQAAVMEGDREGLVQATRQLAGYGSHLMRQEQRQDQGQGQLRFSLALKDGEAVLTVSGPGKAPQACQDPMAELSFGPELALARARRIVEAHGGKLFIGPLPQGDGFGLTAHLPRRQ